jgi:nucleotide-binding universal stress UspA family protein
MAKAIVVGYDGSDNSGDGLALAAELARLTDARLLVAFVYAGKSPFVGAVAASIGVTMREEAEQVLRRGLRHLPADVRSETVALPDSSPARALEELAVERDAAMIVLGSTRFGPVGSILIGSLGRRLLHGAPCAVAVAPRNYRQHPATRVAKVGICWDGSPEAKLALRAAVKLAAMAEAELCVCTAVDNRGFLHPNYPGDYVPEAGGLMEAAQGVAAEALEQVPGHMPASLHVLVGDPAGVIAERAGAEGFDLLVSGSRGYGPVRRVLLGGMSDRLMRMAPCPVLIVPRGAGAPGREPESRDEAAVKI